MMEVIRTFPTDLSGRWTTEKLWPQRLLEVSTMKSVERQGNDTYEGIRQPRYNILSYTWGRFTKPQGKSLPIKAVTWQIPAIDESRFAAASFERVIRKITGENRFVWVDIACIDQENYAVKMEEIGRQAGIFANADRAYVWLWKLPIDSLQPAIDTIMKYGFHMGEVLIDTGDVPVIAAAVNKAVGYVLDDFWFSSLWTLQEGFLRQDAIFLSRDAVWLQNIRHPQYSWPEIPTRVVTVSDLTERLWLLFEFLEIPHGPYHCEGLEEVNRGTSRRIQQAGYISRPSDNPNVQYGIARFRETTHELDRVYGIMAAYNIQVGAAIPAADTSRVYTFEELEEEFAVAINTKSTLLGQMFVHIRQPREGKTWQITQYSRVPAAFTVHLSDSYTYLAAADCVIRLSTDAATNMSMRIEGPICSFEDMCLYWKSMVSDRVANKLAHQIVVDDYILASNPALLRFHPREEVYNSIDKQEKLAAGLKELFDEERISVLRLGTVDRMLVGTAWKEQDTFGLLLLHNTATKKQCQRLGICKWTEDPPKQKSTTVSSKTLSWKTFQGHIF